MKAIVLAAGTGSRLGELTSSRTKGMVPVGGKRLIDHLFDFFAPGFFDEIVVVGGFCWEDLRDHIAASGRPCITVIQNPGYRMGNLYTLVFGLARIAGKDSFLVTNTDHIYPRDMFHAMVEELSGVTAMVDFDRDLGADDMKVKLAPGGDRVAAISKQLTEFDCGYIGMTFVHRDAWETYRAAVDAAAARFGEKAVAENVLQVLAEDPATAPRIRDLSGFGWYEVDDEHDLRRAEKGLADNPRFP